VRIGTGVAPRPLRPAKAMGEEKPSRSPPLPTLFRFLAVVAILAGLVLGGMFALATFVEPTPREMTVTVPGSKLQPGR
jgi:hypothetical protein